MSASPSASASSSPNASAPSSSGPSAADLITYTGVPLTVLGVLPILWNVGKSFRIRHCLGSWIPKEAKKNISLHIDPAAGVVVAGVDGLRLTWQSIFEVMGQGYQESLAERSVRAIDSRLVGGSWMGLYKAKVPFSKIRGASQRLVIDSSMYFPVPGVRCDWETFVFLALALGIDPHSNDILGLSSIRDRHDELLLDAKGKAVLNIQTKSSHSWTVQLLDDLSFSGRKALAWYCIMVVKEGQGVLYSPLATSSAPNISATTLPDLPIILKGLQDIDTIVRSQNECQILGLALTWAFYVESVFYGEGNEELLPVPQFVLKSREDALEKLKKIETSALMAALNKIFENNSNIVDTCMSALRQAWQETTQEDAEGKRRGQGLRDVNNCNGCLNLYQYWNRFSALQLLKMAFHPIPTRRQNTAVQLQDLNQSIAIFARVWLGLSAVQACKRTDWNINFDLSGHRWVQPPDLGLFRDLLSIPKDESKHITIQID